ncbi:unnamed protein product [Closterium sp. NIES-54]
MAAVEGWGDPTNMPTDDGIWGADEPDETTWGETPAERDARLLAEAEQRVADMEILDSGRLVGVEPVPAASDQESGELVLAPGEYGDVEVRVPPPNLTRYVAPALDQIRSDGHQLLLSFFANAEHYLRAQGHKATGETWHKRLGHPSQSTLNNTIKAAVLDKNSLLLLSGLELKPVNRPAPCTICPAANQLHEPFPTHFPGAEDYHLMDKVYSDILNLPADGFNGERYVITFTDASTRYVWTGNMTNRFLAFTAFRTWLPLVERESDTKLKAFQCDGTDEYRNLLCPYPVRLLVTFLRSSRPHTDPDVLLRLRLALLITLISLVRCVSPRPAPPFECPQPVQSQSPLQPVSPLPTPSPYAGPTGGLAERREPASRFVSPVRSTRTSRRAPRPRPPAVPGTHQMTMRPSTAPLRVPFPSPPESSLPVLADPESDSLRAARPTFARLLSTVVTDPSFESTAASALVAELVDFAAHCRLDYAARLVAYTDVLEDRQEEFQYFAAALPYLVSTLLAPEGDPNGPDIPTPRSYAEAIEGPYSSQWQSAMDAEMASWKSTGTYVDEVPPPRANIVSGMWIFRVKRPPGSPPVFKARYVARGFSQRQGVDYFQTFSPTPKMTTLRVLLHVAAQRDYELHSLDFSTAFIQGSLHEKIWLRRPPGFTGSFPPSTQWSLRRPVYGLHQAPREWHDTLRTTLAALGFAPSTADPSLFLRTDTSLPPFYILVYVDDLVFATADTAGLAHVKSKLQKRHTCTDLGELLSYLGLQITRDRAQRTITLTQSHMVQQVLQRFNFTYSSPQATHLPTRHSLSALPSDESVEPSGPYPELVGCLMYLMTCTRPDLAYPLSILARYVAPGRHRPEHMAAAKRVLRYLCSTSGLELVLGGRRPVVLTGHADASWADDQATQWSSQGYTFRLGSSSVSWWSTRSSSVLGSSCEAEICAGAMAARELRWLTYLLTDLGEPPRSPPVLYVDNKAMLALYREHRLEHRTKHIALRYFLARELQQRGQLRLAYVASEANTTDIFTKALPPGGHQRFCTMLGLVPTWPHLLTS